MAKELPIGFTAEMVKAIRGNLIRGYGDTNLKSTIVNHKS